MGGLKVSMLLSARLNDPEDGTVVDMVEPWIKAGMLLTPPGKGSADLSAFVVENFPFLGLEFVEMRTPSLVVVGDNNII